MIKIQSLKSADKKDLAGINRLLRQLSPSSRSLDMRACKRLLADKNFVLFAAKDKDEIVGMACLVVMETPSAVRSRLEDVVVDEAYRGQGIGSSLIEAVVGLARKKGAKSLDFTSNPDREAANKLYMRLGFERRETNVYRMKLA